MPRSRDEARRYIQQSDWIPELATEEEKKAVREYLEKEFEGDSKAVEAEFHGKMDEKIRPIVVDMVHHGYAVSYSCQGGKGHRYTSGVLYIVEDFINTPSDMEEIEGIVKKNTSVSFQIIHGGSGEYAVVFAGPL